MNRKRENGWMSQGKAYVLLLALALLIGLGVRATLAYLIDRTAAKKNEFSYGKVTSGVSETFRSEYGEMVKRNVRLQNTGNTTAYLRALLVFTWKDEEGNVFTNKPVENQDYELDLLLGEGNWIVEDEGYGSYLYYKYPVEPGAYTEELIDYVRQEPWIEGPEDGKYKLSVEIVVDAVQAYPADAVKEAWLVNVDDDGALSVSGGVTYD